MYPATDLILKKRNGQALNAHEIRSFVSGVRDGSVSDAQIAAFAMATWFRGMNVDEQMTLTLAMRDSGEVLRWAGLDGPVVDKHSTGGVGDLVSLVLGPLLAACGAYVPMISGRGLGHTGGTLDKLESIPGFETSLGIGRLQQQVRRYGLAIVGQSDVLAPADRRFYAVRDVTASVSSTPLIVSSILSKKLAEGLDVLMMDIKCGNGAFSRGVDDARELAAAVCTVARNAGLRCRALITNMDQPLAESAGNALEVREAIRILGGEPCNERARDVTLALCAEALTLSGIAASRDAGLSVARSTLESGQAAERFARMVVEQGGPADLLERPDRHLAQAPVRYAVYPEAAGYVAAVDTEALGRIVVGLGGGRRRAEDAVDPSVGLSRICALGGETGPDAPLAIVHAADDSDWERAAAELKASMQVAAEPPQVPSLIEITLQDQCHDHIEP